MTRSHPDQEDYNEDLAEIEVAAQNALRGQNRANHVVMARRVKEATRERLKLPSEAGNDVLGFAKEKLEEYRHPGSSSVRFGAIDPSSGNL